jgi:hypothetical protein
VQHESQTNFRLWPGRCTDPFLRRSKKAICKLGPGCDYRTNKVVEKRSYKTRNAQCEIPIIIKSRRGCSWHGKKRLVASMDQASHLIPADQLQERFTMHPDSTWGFKLSSVCTHGVISWGCRRLECPLANIPPRQSGLSYQHPPLPVAAMTASPGTIALECEEWHPSLSAGYTPWSSDGVCDGNHWVFCAALETWNKQWLTTIAWLSNTPPSVRAWCLGVMGALHSVKMQEVYSWHQLHDTWH